MGESISVPLDLVQQELRLEVPDGTTMLWITKTYIHPQMSLKAIATKYEWDDATREAAANALTMAPVEGATPNVQKSAESVSPHFEDIIFDKLKENFPTRDLPTEYVVGNFVDLVYKEWNDPSPASIDALFEVMVHVDTNVKPVDYPMGFANYLVKKHSADEIIAQAEAHKSRSQTSESLMKRTMRQAEQALKDVQPPSPTDKLNQLKEMRARIGKPQPSSR